jgi:pilus assembly protein TadC
MNVMLSLLAGLAAWFIVGERADRSRLRAVARPANSVADPPPRQNARRLQVAVCLLAAGAAWLLLGGVIGIVAAGAVAVLGPRALSRFEARSDRQRNIELVAAAPLVADIFAACLSAGASPAAAARAAASALGGEAAKLLDEAVGQFQLGASAQRVWRPLLECEPTAPIARAILRSAESGAPLTDVLLRVADDMRAAHRSELEQAAKAVGVKAVGPLGACFLPAFMLLGVVPLIGSLVSEGLF